MLVFISSATLFFLWKEIAIYGIIQTQGAEQTLQNIARRDVPIIRNTANEELANMVKYSFREHSNTVKYSHSEVG